LFFSEPLRAAGGKAAIFSHLLPGTESGSDVLLDINGSGLLQEFANCVKFMQPNCLPMNLIPGKWIEN
jgi:hypothetical protein